MAVWRSALRGPWAGWTMAPRKPPSGRYSPERVTELECAIATLRARQEAQPKAEVERRALLAALISAFERTLETTKAGMDRQKRDSTAQKDG